MDVKSRIASLEAAQSNQVRTSPIRASHDESSPRVAPLDAIGIEITSISSPSPERPLSTTSFASQNRINRLQRQAASIVAASSPTSSVGTPATPITKNKPRAPQPPDSPMVSENASMRQAARERRLMGATGNQKGEELGSPPSSLPAHNRGGPAGTGNFARSASPAGESVNAGDNRNINSNSNGIAAVKSPPRTAKLQRVLAKPRTSGRNITGKSSSRRDTPSETKVPARRQASFAITDSVSASGAGGGGDTSDQRHGMLMPETDQPSEEEKSLVKKSAGRMAKVQQIKKKRSLDQHRRRKKPGSSSSSGQRKQQHQQQVDPPSFAEDDSVPPSPTTVQVVASLDHATDDEMTQTSVRQIVGNAYEESRKATGYSEDCLSPDPGAYGHESSSRLWMEEKNEKDDPVRGGLMIARSSSTEYDTDGEGRSRIASTLYGEDVAQDPSESVVSSSQVTPAEAALLGKNRQKKSMKGKQGQGNNNGTFDYSERDDEGSAASLSYEQRKQKEVREKEARNAAVAAAKAKMDDGPFVQTEDVEHYRKTLDTPIVKTAFGVVGAATVGCILLGPVGLLVGAAAVGIGIGAMQIPEEQRSHMQDKASETMKSVQDSAFNASETLSNSCAASYKDSGIAEHVPADMENCFAVVEDEVGVAENELVDEANDKAHPLDPSGPKVMDGRPLSSPSRTGRVRDQKEKVACLQEGTCLRYSVGLNIVVFYIAGRSTLTFSLSNE
jgi:hypothetical protein